jgi:hypothetical protein
LRVAALEATDSTLLKIVLGKMLLIKHNTNFFTVSTTTNNMNITQVNVICCGGDVEEISVI